MLCQEKVITADLLYKHVLYKHTRNISTKPLGLMALFPVQVSFVISTARNFWSQRRAYNASLVLMFCLEHFFTLQYLAGYNI